MPKKEVKVIDSSIIWKRFHGKLSEKEEQFFLEWMEEDPSHEEYVTKAEQYFERGSSFDENPFKSEEAWQKVAVHIDYKPNRKRNLLRLGVAASVLIAATLLMLVNREEALRTDEVATTIIEPGNSSAMLVIDGGKSYALSEGLDTTLVAIQTTVKTDGTSLEYSEPTSKSSVIAHNTLTTPKGGEFMIVLSDGTKIWLNAESQLDFPEVFIGDTRRVELQGEAYFEVAHNPEKPFYVVSGDHEITVLGTSFNVNAYDDDERIITTLVEGKVRVRDLYDFLEVKLSPNQQSTLHRYKNSLTTKQVDPYQYIAWKDKTFYFEDRTLVDIMKVLSRWYDVDIFFANPETGNIRFTGGFQRYDAFNKISDKIEKTNEVQFEIKGNIVIIQ